LAPTFASIAAAKFWIEVRYGRTAFAPWRVERGLYTSGHFAGSEKQIYGGPFNAFTILVFPKGS